MLGIANKSSQRFSLSKNYMSPQTPPSSKVIYYFKLCNDYQYNEKASTFVTAQQQSQPQKQSNQNCSWLETKQSLRTTHPPTTGIQNCMIE